jgi:hypothetical protein
MKMLGGITASDFKQLVIPNGPQLPTRPVVGEVFRLTVDMPESHSASPWYPAGIYIYNWGAWERLADNNRQRKSGIIGSQPVEIEDPVKPLVPPTYNQGIQLTHVSMRPSNRKAVFSGTASVWVESKIDCQVLLCVWRNNKLIAITAELLKKGHPRTLGITFMDIPFTHITNDLPGNATAEYTLRLCADTKADIFINRGEDQFIYDEVSPATAFIVEENF